MDEMIVARNYASALFHVTQSEKTISELAALSKIFENKRGICVFFDEHIMSEIQRIEWIKKELSMISLEMQNFIQLLDMKNRLSLLNKITVAYEVLFFEKNNMDRIFITTATESTEESIQKIVTIFEQKTKKTLIEKHAIDPSIIGGVMVQIGSQRYDDTIRTKLQKVMRTYEKEV